MDQETERVPLEVESVVVEVQKHHPVRLVIRGVRAFANQPLIMKVKWLLAAMFVFGFAVVLTILQFNGVNSDARDQIKQDQDRANYFQAVADYNNSVNQYNTCIRSTALSLQSRGQHQQGVVAWEHLKEKFPDNAELVDVIDGIITDLNEGPMLGNPPASYDACVSPLLRPTPPAFMLEQGFEPSAPAATVPIPSSTEVP